MEEEVVVVEVDHDQQKRNLQNENDVNNTVGGGE